VATFITDPWRLELYRLREQRLEEVGRSDLATPNVLTSEIAGLTLQLVAGAERPQIQVSRIADQRRWSV
jgi:hypothetical protein